MNAAQGVDLRSRRRARGGATFGIWHAMEFASIANCPADFVGAELWSYACLTVEPTLADYGGTNMSHVNEYSP